MIKFVRLPLTRNPDTLTEPDFVTRKDIALDDLDRRLNTGCQIVTQEKVETKTGQEMHYVLHRAPQKRGANNA